MHSFVFLFLLILVFTKVSQCTLHHIFVGTVNGTSLYTLEFNDIARSLEMVFNSSGAGAHPILAITRNKLWAFGSRSLDGTISRYGNTTSNFKSIQLLAQTERPGCIFGAASSGTCSTIFALSPSGFQTLRSDAVHGDIRSIAFSPNQRHLYALDIHTSLLLNYYISDAPSLQDLLDVDVLPELSGTIKVISHPKLHKLYLVAQNTNELVTVPMLYNDRRDIAVNLTHHEVLSKNDTYIHFFTSSIAISSSASYLWALSQSSNNNNIITVYPLNTTTGDIVDEPLWFNWTPRGGKAGGSFQTSFIAPTPFESDFVAVTSFPAGSVEILGIGGNRMHGIQSLGSVDASVDEGCCGEAAWFD
ncbi:hypothetical protein K469DRAFT_788325 [Zopfia rhizophila CBS 207.26]|uniref:3-carboxy-cis,cis-mucoante lactonizing enzyme n=1 Tax=Zopfia rhizophila CBS 207.26 TaxID=1314779 RepID=A0A6A6DWH2_9PEZI|nr:hypothetical protein K469DRAFT_788325 [Zopfia rhizophila CBS 207.26]